MAYRSLDIVPGMNENRTNFALDGAERLLRIEHSLWQVCLNAGLAAK